MKVSIRLKSLTPASSAGRNMLPMQAPYSSRVIISDGNLRIFSQKSATTVVGMFESWILFRSQRHTSS
ncbi:MAG: hypothetical protein ACD_75C00668G0001 [uncultured bacterium]|nr:MAG: hypothetical protein ACD_75C00668G0001 [uncultured bacterium]